MKVIGVVAVLICVSGTLAACTPRATIGPVERDPIAWPFAADSIWNMPIHNGAKYVDAQIEMPTAAGPTMAIRVAPH